MNKPVWKSRKVWIAVLALLGAVVARYTGSPEIAVAAVALGSVLVFAFGLADLGKERQTAVLDTAEPLRVSEPDRVQVPPAMAKLIAAYAEMLAKKKTGAAVEAVDTPDPED